MTFIQKNRYPSLPDIFIFVGIIFGSQICCAIVPALIKVIMGSSIEEAATPLTNGFETFAIYSVGMLMAIAFCSVYRNKRRGVIKDIFRLRNHLGSFSAPMVLWGLFSTLCIGFLIEPLIALFPESYTKMMESIPTGLGGILTIVVMAPMLEEILFRGIIQGDLTPRYTPWRAILISSLIFAIIHMNIAQSINAFFVSIILGFVYYKSRSLWNVIAIHMINNALSLVLTYLLPKDKIMTPMRDFFHSEWLYYTIYGVVLVLVMITIVYIFRNSRQTTDNSNPVEETNKN